MWVDLGRKTRAEKEGPLKLLMFSHQVMSDSLQPVDYTRFPCPSLYTGVAQTHVHWVRDTIQPSHHAIYIQIKKQQLELDMEQVTGSKSGKEYINKGVQQDNNIHIVTLLI